MTNLPLSKRSKTTASGPSEGEAQAERMADLPPEVRILIEALTGDAVCIVDPKYRIVYWDTKAESLTGLLSEEMTGKRCYEVVLGEGEEGIPLCAYSCPVMHLCEAKRAVPSFDMRIRCRWGAKRWVNVSVLSIDSEEGPYMVHLMRDAQQPHETIEMARNVIQRSSEQEESSISKRRFSPELTPRQSEVLALLSEGKSTKEIGQELYLSQATIRNHIRALLQIFGARSRLQVLARAREEGLLP